MGQHWGRMKANNLPLRWYSSQHQTPNSRRLSVVAKAGPVFLKPIPSTWTKGGVLCSSRKNNAFICFAALVSLFLLIGFSFRASSFSFSIEFVCSPFTFTQLVIVFLYQKYYCIMLTVKLRRCQGRFPKGLPIYWIELGLWMVRNHRVFRGVRRTWRSCSLIWLLMIKVISH